MMNIDEFIKSVSSLGINLTEEMLNRLSIYAEFLIEYNEHTNLTAIKDKDSIYLKHFYDSLTLVKSINLDNYESLVDVGTGAGFPGVVLKIVYPHLNVTLIDSNNKKIEFLKQLIKKLGLEHINALNVRSEEYALNNLDKFDIVTARAVTTLPALIELCLPLVKVNGYFIPLKGNIKEELKISTDILKVLNGRVEEVIEFNLPKEESIRSLAKIIKIEETPSGYPRSYDKIKKSLKKYIK
ncbi:MAG: 16S rRNA (guanine(527)-N(7))-methyltransferase RsmG [Erysipelotrichales bacterium]|nr:16S rRNA (guanine(527)-N(7))-methyltransferase RsmG [Erysipelotrichales bacterium]